MALGGTEGSPLGGRAGRADSCLPLGSPALCLLKALSVALPGMCSSPQHTAPHARFLRPLLRSVRSHRAVTTTVSVTPAVLRPGDHSPWIQKIGSFWRNNHGRSERGAQGVGEGPPSEEQAEEFVFLPYLRPGVGRPPRFRFRPKMYFLLSLHQDFNFGNFIGILLSWIVLILNSHCYYLFTLWSLFFISVSSSFFNEKLEATPHNTVSLKLIRER